MENMTKEQAEIILKIRDALALENIDEAYHCLYQIASPDFDKINPWSELERIAASGSVAAPKEEPKGESEPKIKSIIPFLLGEDSYDGYWWQDKPTDKRPPFWWRTKLREEVEAKDAEIKHLRNAIAIMTKTIKTE